MNINAVIGRLKSRREADRLRHARKCHICHHSRRAEIEWDYLNWIGPTSIVEEYKLPNYSAIYRHAHALGLAAQRAENILTALDMLIEKVESARVTGNTIIRAMRAYSCIKPGGRWEEPPKQVVVATHRSHTPRGRNSNRKSGIRIPRNPMKTNTRSNS
jgi:hypothetical protein